MSFTNERVLNGKYGLNGLPNHDTADKSYRMGVETTVDWNFWDNFHYVLNASLSRNKITTDTYDNNIRSVHTEHKRQEVLGKDDSDAVHDGGKDFYIGEE